MTTQNAVRFIHRFDNRRVPYNPKTAHRRMSRCLAAVPPAKEYTCAYMVSAATREILCAIALCNPMDNFSRPKGRTISTARLKNFEHNPEAGEKRPNLFFKVPFSAIGVADGAELETIHPKIVHDVIEDAANRAVSAV